MKHAYLILAHGNWGLLKMLISAIDDERNDIYIHIDSKVDKLPILSAKKARLSVLNKRIDVRWGDVSQVEAEYALLEEAFKNKDSYCYFHLLSGVDLPLKSQDYIHDFFNQYPGEEFIGYTETKASPMTYRKVCRWHLFPRHFKSKSLLVKGLRASSLKFQEMAGIKRNINIDFKKGSNWVSITPELVSILLSKQSWAMKTFSHTFCADEVFVQTICWNSPLREKIHNTENDAKGCLRAIGWRNGHLYDWSANDYETLASSEALFARKFNLEDPAFLEKVLALSINKSEI